MGNVEEYLLEYESRISEEGVEYPEQFRRGGGRGRRDFLKLN